MSQIAYSIGRGSGGDATQNVTHCTIHAYVAAVMLTVAIAMPASAQNGTRSKQNDGARWDNGVFRAGDTVRLEPHARFQTDLLLTDHDVQRSRFIVHRSRVLGSTFKVQRSRFGVATLITRDAESEP